MIRHNTLRHILTALLLFMAVIYGQTAFATTKTVTYTITEVNTVSSSQVVTITRSGDTPFEGGSTTYTMSVSNSSLGNGSGNYSVMLADGFQLSISWSVGSNVTLMSNTFRPGSGKSINCNINTNPNDYYYVTNLQIRGMEGVWSDTNYDYQWQFGQYKTTQYSFGGYTVTYTDYPSLSIFESAGNNAYKITDKDELQHLANYVNNGKNDCEDLTFLQTKDITGDDSYTPIGFSYNNQNDAPFSGTFDGYNNTISGIRYRETFDHGYRGLFGRLGNGCTIKNLTLADSRISGKEYTGGIAGQNHGTISNCIAWGVTIPKLPNSGIITGYNNGSLVENYYHDCAQGSFTDNIGCENGDCHGARRVQRHHTEQRDRLRRRQRQMGIYRFAFI